MKTFSHLWQYLAEVFLEWEMFQINVVEKIKIHILRPVTFFSENSAVYEKKCGGAIEAADGNTAACECWISRATLAQAHASARAPTLQERTCTHSQTHTQTHKGIYKTYCFFTETVISWTRLSVTLYIYCLSCYKMFVDIDISYCVI